MANTKGVIVDINNCSFDDNGELIIHEGCQLGIVWNEDCDFMLGDPKFPVVNESCSNFASVRRIRECTVKIKGGEPRQAWLCEFIRRRLEEEVRRG